MSWINGPLYAVDTETTGVSEESDRIVTVSVGKYQPGQLWRSADYLIAVDEPIPESATAVHGITTEHAREHGERAADVLAEVDDHLQWGWRSGAPVIGHNVRFDLTILDREMRRHLDHPLIISGPVIDSMCLDRHVDRYRPKKVASRKLPDACRHYGITLSEEDAHSASGDCLAAARLAWKIAKKYGLADMSLEELHQFQVGWYAEQTSSLVNHWRQQGKPLDDESLDWPLIPYADKKVHA